MVFLKINPGLEIIFGLETGPWRQVPFFGASQGLNLASYGLFIQLKTSRGLKNCGPMEWPPRSPDLTQCDFWLWGHLKHIVYQNTYNDLDSLKEGIREAWATIGPEHIEKVLIAFKERMWKVIDVEGEHIENLL